MVVFQPFVMCSPLLAAGYHSHIHHSHRFIASRREGIQWDPLDFPDNHAIVDLVGGKVGKTPLGILPMLDEERCLTSGRDAIPGND